MRVKNVARNSFFSLLSQFALIIVGFFSQRVLNHYMGEELVGMNSVISNIIAILSVSELGISTAIVYHLYAALARDDELEISALMNLYRKAYHIFAGTIFTLGLIMLPFVHLFLKDNSFSLSYIRLIYVLWLIRTVFSYLLSYRRSILVADQKEYIVSIVMLFVNIINYSLIILIVRYTRRYEVALGLNAMVEMVSNLLISRYIDQKYPYLRRNAKIRLERGKVRDIFENIRNIFVMRLAGKLFVSTDNLIVSGMINVTWAGRFSNYSLITNSIVGIANAIAGAFQPSIGDMYTEKDHKKNYEVFRQLSFLFFLFTAAAVSGVYACVTPFVRDYWLGSDYVMGENIVLVFVMSFAMSMLSIPIATMMGVTGLFRWERNITAATAVVNLVASIGLVYVAGIRGIMLGTILAYIIQISARIFVFFKVYLKHALKEYLWDMAEYLLLIYVEAVAVHRFSNAFYIAGSPIRFLGTAVVSVLVPTVCNLIIFCKSWRFKSVFRLALGLLRDRSKSD